jgi:putative copper export protein
MRELLWPDVEVQPRVTAPGTERYVRSYLIMRVAVGVLGIAVPLLLVFGEPLLFDGQPFPRGSLSAYYYSGVRELFVGALCAIGVFLLTYKVAERSRENRLSIYAGVAVITVALFPTARPGEGVTPTPLQDLLSETTVERIHFIAAAVFIASLAVISYYFAKPPPNQRTRRSFWRRYHLACAGFIVAALILAAVAGITGWPDKGLLIAEAVAVWAFGASWLMKGLELDVLLGRRKARSTRPAAPQSVAPRRPSS